MELVGCWLSGEQGCGSCELMLDFLVANICRMFVFVL